MCLYNNCPSRSRTNYIGHSVVDGYSAVKKLPAKDPKCSSLQLQTLCCFIISWASSVYFTSLQPVSPGSILVLCSCLHLVLPCGVLRWGFVSENYIYIYCSPYSSQVTLLYLNTNLLINSSVLYTAVFILQVQRMNLLTGGQALWVLQHIGYWEKTYKQSVFIQEWKHFLNPWTSWLIPFLVLCWQHLEAGEPHWVWVVIILETTPVTRLSWDCAILLDSILVTASHTTAASKTTVWYM